MRESTRVYRLRGGEKTIRPAAKGTLSGGVSFQATAGQARFERHSAPTSTPLAVAAGARK